MTGIPTYDGRPSSVGLHLVQPTTARDCWTINNCIGLQSDEPSPLLAKLLTGSKLCFEKGNGFFTRLGCCFERACWPLDNQQLRLMAKRSGNTLFSMASIVEQHTAC